MITLASAKDYESSLSISTKEITVNQCGIATYDLTLTNKGEKEDTYYVLVEGIPEGWYSVSHESLTLKPKESKNIYLFITASCFEEPKNYSGKISFLGNSESLTEFKMNVISDHSISISLPENISSCICEESSFIAVIENTGKYDEEVKLSVVGGKIKEDKIKIKSGEKRQLEVFLDKVCGITPGKYNFEIIAESTTSYAKTRKIFEVIMQNCHDFEFSYPKEVKTCLNEKVDFGIAVKNTGSKDDDYILIMDALNIAQEMQIKSGEIKVFNVNFSSNDIGIIDIGFTVKTKTKEEKGNIRFLVDQCYGIDLQPETNKIDIQLGSGKMLKAKITNTGSKDDVYKISSDINWVSIRPENISLKGKQTDEVFVYYSPQYGMKGKFETQLKAESAHSIDIENITINVYESLPIEPQILENITQETTLENQTQITGQIAKTSLENFIQNKTLVAIITGVLLTLIVFGLIYLFVMRD